MGRSDRPARGRSEEKYAIGSSRHEAFRPGLGLWHDGGESPPLNRVVLTGRNPKIGIERDSIVGKSGPHSVHTSRVSKLGRPPWEPAKDLGVLVSDGPASWREAPWSSGSSCRSLDNHRRILRDLRRLSSAQQSGSFVCAGGRRLHRRYCRSREHSPQAAPLQTCEWAAKRQIRKLQVGGSKPSGGSPPSRG